MAVNDANPNHQPNAQGYFCPSCGAADITASGLSGGLAKCNICSWNGRVEELATFHFTHDMGSPDEVFRAFFLDVRKVMARTFAEEFGKVFIKWGFMDVPDEKNHKAVVATMARYMGSIAIAICKAVVAERQKIEREKHSGPPDAAA